MNDRPKIVPRHELKETSRHLKTPEQYVESLRDSIVDRLVRAHVKRDPLGQ